MASARTQYRVVLDLADGRRWHLGWTARTTRSMLVSIARASGDAVVALSGVTDDDAAAFRRDAVGRWWLWLGPKARVGYSGETRLHHAQLPSVI